LEKLSSLVFYRFVLQEGGIDGRQEDGRAPEKGHRGKWSQDTGSCSFLGNKTMVGSFSLERGKYTFIDDQFLSVYERSGYMTYNLSLLVRYELDMVNISGSDSKAMALFLYFLH